MYELGRKMAVSGRVASESFTEKVSKKLGEWPVQEEILRTLLANWDHFSEEM